MKKIDLINEIESLKKSHIDNVVSSKIQDFKNINKNSNDDLFKELCFCILTANFNAEKSIKIQDELGESFLSDSKEDLANKLKQYGHRFPNTRAEYILDSRKHKDKLNEIIQNHNNNNLREWFVKNIKGLGFKEASHFLRNIGFDDFAIIDFHIVDILVKHNLIKRPNSLSKKRYLEIESVLEELARKLDLSLAELDLYLWYIETGKILK